MEPLLVLVYVMYCLLRLYGRSCYCAIESTAGLSRLNLRGVRRIEDFNIFN
jgi:hypothetical protein